MEEPTINLWPCTASKRRWLPVGSPHASTIVPQVGSLAHRSQFGARFADPALLFPAQTRAPPGRHILPVFERGLLPAGGAVEVDNPVYMSGIMECKYQRTYKQDLPGSWSKVGRRPIPCKFPYFCCTADECSGAEKVAYLNVQMSAPSLVSVEINL